MNKLLASTWMLYFKTQTALWSIGGGAYSLNKMLELQLKDLSEAINSLGLQITSKGEVPISTWPELVKESLVVDILIERLSEEDTLRFLLEANKAIISHIEGHPDLKANFGDRLSAHTKWMWFFDVRIPHQEK